VGAKLLKLFQIDNLFTSKVTIPNQCAITINMAQAETYETKDKFFNEILVKYFNN